MVDGLPVPMRLLALIDQGLWPRADWKINQDYTPLVPKERVRLFAPWQDAIVLYPPPFYTVAKFALADPFYSEFGLLDGIAPELCVEIGDFGLGSDAPLLLDYRQDRANPTVIRPERKRGSTNVWVVCAKNFEEFADTLGLDEPEIAAAIRNLVLSRQPPVVAEQTVPQPPHFALLDDRLSPIARAWRTITGRNV